MVKRPKEVIYRMSNEEHWALSRCSAREKKSMRELVKAQLKPFFDDLLKRYPRIPVDNSGKIDGLTQKPTESP